MSGGRAPEDDRARRALPAAIVLAAGRSRRMGARNKLLLSVDGVPMVRRVAETALGAGLDPVVVVLGHEAEGVRRTLEGLPVTFVENRGSEAGLSDSLEAGIDALPPGCAATVVLLADMPWVGREHLQALSGAFDAGAGREICVPVHRGRRGNPVLWGSRFFDEMRSLEGDVGAKALMERHPTAVHEVPVDDDAVVRDVDTPEAWASHGRVEAPWPP